MRNISVRELWLFAMKDIHILARSHYILDDARTYQILFLACFLCLGIGTRDWTLRPDLIAVVIVSCLLSQWCLSALVEYTKQKNNNIFLTNSTDYLKDSIFSHKVISSLRSALITALGLCLLLRGNNYTTMAVASCLAIASKFLFRFRGKHFFNPANFGIIIALILTNDAWVSPGQWGTDWWYLLLFTGMGGIVLKKVGRWDTSVAFLLTYASLEAIRNFWLGWGWEVWQHQFMSGSLLLFALFMLTDPRSIPNAGISRLIWAVSIAVVTFILQDYFYISIAIFWALFIISPLTIFFDRVWSAPRFTWKRMLVVSG
ncbi:MAG: RnfABCDGE type electron transport complex subunit D [Xenococcaceae cyanobacterium MO_188.B32]|nr:RnfABCDGE type electron transport complex subunit D [Xenococcaceae cyanobacterium MO_188.B32]